MGDSARMPEYHRLTVALDEAIGTITLNDPERLNPLDYSLLRDLASATHWLEAQGATVVVLTGAGRCFSAGFDMREFANMTTEAVQSPAQVRENNDLGRQAAEALSNVRAITIAAVHGYCVGGAVVLVAACDLRLSSDDAVFWIPEVDMGIPLAWGGMTRLVREVGPAAAKDLVMTCRRIRAPEALAMGFLSRVVPAAALHDEAGQLAAALAAKSKLVLLMTKAQANAAAESLSPTFHNFADTDMLATALRDPESRRIAQAYVAAQEMRRSEAATTRGA